MWGRRRVREEVAPPLECVKSAMPGLSPTPKVTREQFVAEMKRMLVAVESGEPAEHGVYCPGGNAQIDGRTDGSGGSRCVDLTAPGKYNEGYNGGGQYFSMHWIVGDAAPREDIVGRLDAQAALAPKHCADCAHHATLDGDGCTCGARLSGNHNAWCVRCDPVSDARDCPEWVDRELRAALEARLRQCTDCASHEVRGKGCACLKGRSEHDTRHPLVYQEGSADTPCPEWQDAAMTGAAA